MSLVKIITGKRGEDQARKFLKKQGYKILKQNYRCRYGEIDLVARDGNTIVFVEVKSRLTDRFGSPKCAVNTNKKRHIKRASQNFLKEFNITELPARFDVVSIEIKENLPHIELVKNAFEAD